MNDTINIENKFFKLSFEDLTSSELKYIRNGLFYTKDYNSLLSLK